MKDLFAKNLKKKKIHITSISQHMSSVPRQQRRSKLHEYYKQNNFFTSPGAPLYNHDSNNPESSNAPSSSAPQSSTTERVKKKRGGRRPNMKSWSLEEDTAIIDLVRTSGQKWKRITQKLPGRTLSSIRNRWIRLDSARKMRMQGKESKNICKKCGKPRRGHVCTGRIR